ncbi:MAG: class I SAM-dependent methyltransferase [Fimbriiglobus sp.]
MTHTESRLTVVDTFQGGSDQSHFDLNNLETRFRASTAAHADRIHVHVGRSSEVLRTLIPASYDFIYIDASHEADVPQDAILAWPLLKVGGLLGSDDYAWQCQSRHPLPPSPQRLPTLARKTPRLT